MEEKKWIRRKEFARTEAGYKNINNIRYTIACKQLSFGERELHAEDSTSMLSHLPAAYGVDIGL